MRILIVHGRDVDKNVRQLADAAVGRGHEVTLASLADFSAYVEPGKSLFWVKGERLERPDVCFLRSFGGMASYDQVCRRLDVIQHLESLGVQVINPVESVRKSKDKYATAFTLVAAGIRVPKTLVTERAVPAYFFSRRFSEVICKPMIGSMGFGSMKFNDGDLAYNALQLLEGLGRPIYVQEYLPGKEDFRVFVIGERVVASVRREATEGWKTNVAQGAVVKEASPPPGVEAVAIKATKVLNLHYAGVDVVGGLAGEPVVLEVNCSPSWQALQKATGVNVAQRLIDYAERLEPGAPRD